MPCLMTTWSRPSSVICGRNECGTLARTSLLEVAGAASTLPLVGRVANHSAFTRVFDALRRAGWGSCFRSVLRADPTPDPSPQGGGERTADVAITRPK